MENNEELFLVNNLIYHAHHWYSISIWIRPIKSDSKSDANENDDQILMTKITFQLNPDLD